MLATIFGTLILCSITKMIISQILPVVRKIISPLVSGIVVLIIGLSLINIGLINSGGGYKAMSDNTFGNFENLFLAISVIVSIIVLNLFKNIYIRISSLFIAVIIGVLIAYFLKDFSFVINEQSSLFFIPEPLYYGFNIDYQLILPFVLVFMVTSLETIGDITATSEVSNQPIKGEIYIKRLKGWVLANSVNSCISAFFNTFLNSCFSQNNGVIALTGVSSRYVGYFVGILLIILGSFPIIANLALQIPEPILGGATLVMFGTIAATGIRINLKKI